MNFKITKESHDELSKIFLTEYPFGSRLHGVATEESDLKLHGNIEKKRFQSARCIYMARCLMYNIKPSVSDIVTKKELIVPSTEDLMALEQVLRDELNDMYNKNSIKGFPEFKEEDVLVKMMVDANNMKEYRC